MALKQLGKCSSNVVGDSNDDNNFPPKFIKNSIS